jgi:hypothetical protein
MNYSSIIPRRKRKQMRVTTVPLFFSPTMILKVILQMKKPRLRD